MAFAVIMVCNYLLAAVGLLLLAGGLIVLKALEKYRAFRRQYPISALESAAGCSAMELAVF